MKQFSELTPITLMTAPDDTELHSFEEYVEQFRHLFESGKSLPLGEAPLPALPDPHPGPPVMIFSPHPDDECIIGGLPYRLRREAGTGVVNVAVTQGSNRDRQGARLTELVGACRYLDFELVQTAPDGLEKINLSARNEEPAHWSAAVETIAGIIEDQRPTMLFFPHEDDWNSTHIGTHILVSDALRKLPSDYSCLVVHTEFWAPMHDPNLVIESSAHDVAQLINAVTYHAGEVQRNPYHLLMPAWMMDNVRRGTELVGGQGGEAPFFSFATLYRIGRWKNGRLHNILDDGRFLAADDPVESLLGLA